MTVRDQRTKVDWAHEVADLMENRFRNARKVTLVCDNLNTHTKGAIYQAFPAERARRIVDRLDLCHTPKHGSWLNIAENELSSMTRQCIKRRRFGTIRQLRKETKAWYTHSNARHRIVDWQMSIGDARIKLSRFILNSFSDRALVNYSSDDKWALLISNLSNFGNQQGSPNSQK